jgi:hypothetical protein
MWFHRLAPSVLLLVSACAGPMDRETVRDEMEPYIAACSQRHGYSPSDADRLGPHEIAPSEREWRSCIYRGIEQIVIPKTHATQNFRDLIDADRRYTDDVAAGRITRAQRRQRLELMLDRALGREAELDKEVTLTKLGDAAQTQSIYSSPTDTYGAFSAQDAAIRNSGLRTVRGALR